MHWLARHRRLVIAATCFAATALVLLGRSFPGVPFLFAPYLTEQRFEDLLRGQGRVTPEREDYVFVGIDQQSLVLDAVGEEEIASDRGLQLMKERSFPWSREVWALLLDKLFAAGARLVVFDMIFSPPNDGDPAFAAALERYRDKVVLGANFDVARDNQLVLPNTTLIPPPQEKDDRVGFVNFWPDATDSKVRAIHFRVSERQLAGQKPFPGDQIFESLSARALAKLGHGALPAEMRSWPIRFGPAGAYEPLRLYELFLPAAWRANFSDGAFFKDKIVMIGASAQVMHDVVDTPLGPSTHGPALHLHAMAAASAGEFLSFTPVPVGIALLCGGGVMAWMLVALLRRPLFSLFALLGVALAYLITARVLYDTTGFFLFTVPVLTVLLLGGLLSMGFEYALERMEKLRTRRTLERYVSKNLVKEILENPSGYYNTLKGARKPVSVLFADLIGFTNLSERAEPEELVAHLNELLSAMVAVVFQNNGTLDKFIGDAIMAVWGNVSSAGAREDAAAAARTALGMRRALKELNQRWAKEGRMPLGMGIGINHGEAIVGNIGSYAPHERLDPTVIGDAVNLASRLEALTRTYGVDILVGDAAAELIRGDFHLRSVARVQVKGKTVPVAVHALLCAKGDEYDAEFLKWLESYEEGIASFRRRDFTEAKILFARFLEFYPDDYLAKMYLERSLEYEQQPPDESWNAAEVFTKK
jgi:adenylate cyclase